jgi:membrane protease YdiL (CAAX protease family)
MTNSNISQRSTVLSKSLSEIMRQYPLVSFFVLAYGISWVLSIPTILSEWNFLPKSLFVIFFTIKSFGPFLAAYIMTRTLEGKEGWLKLRGSTRTVRVGWLWYVFILLGIPALLLLSILILPGALESFKGFPAGFPIVYLVNFVLIFFGGGPLGEEPGWRGFALSRMQSRFGALKATLLLGVLWNFWHLPDFLTSAQGGGPAMGLSPFYTRLPIFFLMVMALAIVFTWVYNNTRGSLFIALLLHTSLNTFGIVLPLFSASIVTSTDLVPLISFTSSALLILILTRGQLGYQPDNTSGKAQ